MDVVTVLLGISLILFFGFFAQFIFKKLGIPDVLFLLILGFVVGPYVFDFVRVEQIQGIAPIFTTFTLLFLLFDGAFNINLSTLIKEFSSSFLLTVYNFFVSSILIMIVMKLFGFTWLISLLTGFLLGGVSSSFVIPVLQGMKVKEKIYSLLALESALTDVFCIVFSLTVIEIINLGSFGLQETFTQIASLFAVAGLVGVIGGIIWIVLIIKVFKEHSYMMVIAYVVLLYVITEFLQGNGAIACLFFGLILKNSKQISSIVRGLVTSDTGAKKKAMAGSLGVSVTTPSEEYFYHQISFLLKTFFFVYVGLLLDLSDMRALLIGGILSVLLMVSRTASLALTRKDAPEDRSLVNIMFARGLAAAAVAQVAITLGVPHAPFLAKVAYVVITGTILLSSIRVFMLREGVKLPFDL